MTGLDTTPVPILLPPAAARRIRIPAGVLAVGAVVITLLAGFGIAAAVGISVFIVETPSMGSAAPVGTLIVAQRPAEGDIRVGDVVTYRQESRTVTHRVVGVTPSGYRLQGDINGASDARTVPPSMVVGKAVAILPGIGWALRIAPWLAIGALSVWALTLPVVSGTTRAALRLVGLCAMVTMVLLALRPLIPFDVLMQMPTTRGMDATVVATGLLPVRLTAVGGGTIDASPGQVVHLLLPANDAGRVTMTSGLALDPVGWTCLVLLCLAPLLAVLTIGLPHRAAEE